MVRELNLRSVHRHMMIYENTIVRIVEHLKMEYGNLNGKRVKPEIGASEASFDHLASINCALHHLETKMYKTFGTEDEASTLFGSSTPTTIAIVFDFAIVIIVIIIITSSANSSSTPSWAVRATSKHSSTTWD